MIRINLLPAESIKKKTQADMIVLGGLGGGLVFVIILSLFVFQYVKKNRLEKNLEIAKNELKKYQDIVNEVERLKQEKASLERRRNIIRSLISGRLTYPKFLDELIATLPEGVWFTNCNTDSEGDTIKVTVTASSFNNYAIADWITTLEGSKSFSGVELDKIDTQEKQQDTSKRKQSVFNFILKFNFRRI